MSGPSAPATEGAPAFEVGAYTFADVAADGHGVDAARRIPELLEEIALADEVGLDVFGIGEHHRPGFAAPAPAVLLAAAAARTSRIRLTSTVTVLSTDDPVRVFEQFTALDLVSSGRAEVMAGRGAFVEPFRLFGHELDDYDDLFDEKLGLLVALREAETVTWSGRHRPPLRAEPIQPRPVQRRLPVWVGVGGTPSSVVRAARLGLPVAIGVLGGRPRDLAPMVDLHRQVLREAGQPPQPVGITLHGFVAETSQRAADVYFPADAGAMNRVAAERGMALTTRTQFDAKVRPEGAYAVGSPQQVVDELLHQHEHLGHQRVMIQLAIGDVAHRDVMRALELLGGSVAPVVRAEVARRHASPGLVAVGTRGDA